MYCFENVNLFETPNGAPPPLFAPCTSSPLALVASMSSMPFKTCLSSDTTSTKNDNKDSSKTHSGGTGTTVAIICLAVTAVVLFAFFLFKLWQKKKREEQYARLLKLFEEDDELEVELGLRD